MSTVTFYPGVLLPVVSPLIGGTNHVVMGNLFLFDVLNTVTVSVTSTFNNDTNISASVNSTFNTKQQVYVVTPFSDPNLVRPIVWPIDARKFTPGIAFNVTVSTFVTKMSTFNAGQRRAVNELSSFNVLQQNITFGKKAYGLPKPVVAPIDMSLFTAGTAGWITSSWNVLNVVTASKTSTFNLIKNLGVSKNIRFNVLIPVTTLVISTFNDQGIHVVASVNSSFNARQTRSNFVQSNFRMQLRLPINLISTFNDLISATASKTSRFNVLNSVSKQATSTWNLKQQLTPFVNIRFNDNARIGAQLTASNWRLFKLVTPSVLSYFRVGINPNGPVTASATSTFNVYKRLSASKISTFNAVGRTSVTLLSQFNTLRPIVVTGTVTFNTGAWPATHIRQTAQQRIDFAY